ncbi:hypothetical protein K438DRAFT_1989596 [Mycena galopus ATCC 62051]|nr:hypothetical protein K438DRAFT_1989596 [Mycena galopus ATCC 62051]
MIDLIGRAIDSFSAWNGGVTREVHACATWNPTPRNIDSDSEAELDTPFIIKCCRFDRVRFRIDRVRLILESEMRRRPPHSSPLALAESSSLPPSYATPYATSRRRCSIPRPLPHHRVVAVKLGLARPLTMPHATLTSSSFACGRLFYRSSVAPLNLHVVVILIHIAQLCATFPLTALSFLVHDDCWQCLRIT